MQTFRQTDPKPIMLRTRAPVALVVELKSLAVKRDQVFSAVVRQALATGVRVMLEAEDKTTEVTT